jgi:hypothetical protein
LPLRRLPNGNMGVQSAGGAGSGTINNYVTVTVQGGNTNAETGAATAQATVKAMEQIARKQLVEARRPGGINNPMRTSAY